MNIAEEEILKKSMLEILRNTPSMPFLCLPMSAMLYAILNDNHKMNSKIATGDLSYKGQIIFKQDFSISSAPNDAFNEWAGHAWVEIDGLICDLSFFRTLYSSNFTKPCKDDLINFFGEGKGSLAATSQQLSGFGLEYVTKDYLSDDIASGIINGFRTLLEKKAEGL